MISSKEQDRIPMFEYFIEYDNNTIQSPLQLPKLRGEFHVHFVKTNGLKSLIILVVYLARVFKVPSDSRNKRKGRVNHQNKYISCFRATRAVLAFKVLKSAIKTY